MTKSKIFWDNASKNYDDTEKRFEYIHAKSRSNTIKHLGDDDIVLDFGCGTGTSSFELSSYVKRIHAIDISPKMIEIAKKKAAIKKVKNVTFEPGEIFDERFEKESFDKILAFNMLHTVPDSQAALKKIHELLRPDGLFISVTPCLRDRMSFPVNLQIQFVRVLCKIGIIPVPIRRLKSTELDELMASTGFQTVMTEKIYKGASSYFMVSKKVE